MVSFFSEVSQRYTERPCTKGEHTYNVRGGGGGGGDNYSVTTLERVKPSFWGGAGGGGGNRRSVSCLSWRVAWKTIQVQILQVIEVVVEPDVSLCTCVIEDKI